jgi:hypothetical protein
MDLTTYSDPFEYPDWRWTRIKSLLKEKKSPTKRDDKYVHRGFKFAQELDACDGSDAKMLSLASKYRDVSKAVGLRNNRSNRKYYLEALALCADMDETGIAKYLGEPPITVRYYLKLFFDVREHLDQTGYLCSRVFEPAVLQAVQDCKDSNISWKMAALFGGYEAVLSCWEIRGATKKAAKYFYDAGTTTMMKDFGLGQALRPLNKYNADLVAENVMKFVELELKSKALSGASGIGEQHVDTLKEIMGSMKFFVADPNAKLPSREHRLYEKIDQSLVAAVIGEQS